MAEQSPARRVDEIPAQAGDLPGVEVRRLKRLEDVELKALDVAPGQATPFHVHPHAHEAVVTAGVGALRGDDGASAHGG